jgi:hypothetical protein
MIARIITWQSTQVGLLVAPPEWGAGVKIELEIPTDVSKQPITFAESRRTFAQSARYKMTWKSYLPDAASATELRLFLTRVRSESVLAPLWPDVCELATATLAGATSFTTWDNPVRSGSNWLVAAPDFSVWEIVAVTGIVASGGQWTISVSPGAVNPWPVGTFLFPLMLGRLEKRPQPEAITDESLEAEFVMKESSDYPYVVSTTPVALTLVGGNIPSFSALPLWDIAPNFSKPLDWTEMPDVFYQQVGFLRSEQLRDYQHKVPRGQELEFYQADRTSLAKIETFWRNSLGTTLRFCVPTYRGDLRMLADTPGGSTLIRCEKSYFSDPTREAQPGDPFIALIDLSNNVTPYQVTTTDLPTETDLNALNNVTALPAATTIVSALLLARFADAKLQWDYTTPYLATARIKFIDLPAEYAGDYFSSNFILENGTDTFVAEDGSTILITEATSVLPPVLPQPAYLFILNETGIAVSRYTSYEQAITIASGTYAGTYTPAPFAFDKVKLTLKLDQEKMDIQSFKFTNNPLNKMWPFALDGILTIEIVEVDSQNPSSTTAISRFYGDVWSIDSAYKATAIPYGNLFERKFPRFLLSVTDNYTQFSSLTQISATSFQYVGTLPAVIDHTTQTLQVTSAAGFAQVQSFFAGGWLETGTGPTFERRSIFESVPSGTANVVTLYIDRPLLKAAGSQSLNFYPGYDGSIDQCDTKFSNRINFGGQPYIPNINPAVKAIKPQKTKGGKKA